MIIHDNLLNLLRKEDTQNEKEKEYTKELITNILESVDRNKFQSTVKFILSKIINIQTRYDISKYIEMQFGCMLGNVDLIDNILPFFMVIEDIYDSGLYNNHSFSTNRLRANVNINNIAKKNGLINNDDIENIYVANHLFTISDLKDLSFLAVNDLIKEYFSFSFEKNKVICDVDKMSHDLNDKYPHSTDLNPMRLVLCFYVLPIKKKSILKDILLDVPIADNQISILNSFCERLSMHWNSHAIDLYVHDILSLNAAIGMFCDIVPVTHEIFDFIIENHRTEFSIKYFECTDKVVVQVKTDGTYWNPAITKNFYIEGIGSIYFNEDDINSQLIELFMKVGFFPISNEEEYLDFILDEEIYQERLS